VLLLFQVEQDGWLSSPKSEALRGTRKALPAHAKRSEFLSVLQQSRVVIVSGATGCGKSTQMPQYILEEVKDTLSLKPTNPYTLWSRKGKTQYP
jgi:HrpA-like RNA helicase